MKVVIFDVRQHLMIVYHNITTNVYSQIIQRTHMPYTLRYGNVFRREAYIRHNAN